MSDTLSNKQADTLSNKQADTLSNKQANSITKLYIAIKTKQNDMKLVQSKFSLEPNFDENKITIKCLDCHNSIIQIPIYNKYNGLSYYPIAFPMTIKIENFINEETIKEQPNRGQGDNLKQYILSSMYNIIEYSSLENPLDWLLGIKKTLGMTDNIQYLWKNFDRGTLIESEINADNLNNNIIKIKQLTFENIYDDIRTFWELFNQIKFDIIRILIFYRNIKKIIKNYDLKQMIKRIVQKKYPLSFEPSTELTFRELYFSKQLAKPTELIVGNTYWIQNKKNLSKILKINVESITEQIIKIPNVAQIIFNEWNWTIVNPLINITPELVCWEANQSKIFNTEILSNVLGITNIVAEKILDYYYNSNDLTNLLALIPKTFTYENIISSGFYSTDYIDWLINNDPKLFYNICNIISNKYSYPINKNTLEFNFDNLIYISLKNIDKVFINDKFNNLSEKLDINVKTKNTYINVMKILKQALNNDYSFLIFGKKISTDIVIRQIIRLFIENVSKSKSVIYFNSIIKPSYLAKFKQTFNNILLLNSTIVKLNWGNVPKRLNLLSIFYKNMKLIYYQDKLNSNIIPDNIDYKIKAILSNPYEMYKYVRKETDFIRWTLFISDFVQEMFLIPISLSSTDIEKLGKLIYLLYNIKEQNMESESYKNFVECARTNPKLLIHANRINLNLKAFPNLLNHQNSVWLNLGILYKNIIDSPIDITISNNTQIPEQIIEMPNVSSSPQTNSQISQMTMDEELSKLTETLDNYISKSNNKVKEIEQNDLLSKIRELEETISKMKKKYLKYKLKYSKTTTNN